MYHVIYPTRAALGALFINNNNANSINSINIIDSINSGSSFRHILLLLADGVSYLPCTLYLLMKTTTDGQITDKRRLNVVGVDYFFTIRHVLYIMPHVRKPSDQ